MRNDPKYNIDSWLRTSKDLFNLTMNMHNEANQQIGKPVYDLDAGWKLYENSHKTCYYIDDMWKSWHYFSANTKVEDSTQLKAYMIYTLTMRELMVCPEYKNIFDSIMRSPQNNIQKWSRSQKDLFTLSWNVHNEVNKRLNKPAIEPLEKMWEEYHEDEGCDACSVVG